MIFVQWVSLPPGTRLQGHGHESGHVCLVEGGSFEERVSGRTEACHPGTLRVSRPGTEHEITAGSEGVDCLLLEFPGTFLDDATPTLVPSFFCRYPSITSALPTLMRRGGPDRDWELESAIYELMARVGRENRFRRAGVPPAWLRRVRDRLAAGGDRRPELSELATESGVNACHLVRSFRDHYGMSMGEWARRRRLERARHLISRGQDSLSRIAVELGFADQPHLTRDFRARYGVTPGVWRRLMARAT